MAGIGTPEYTDRVLAQAVDAKRRADDRAEGRHLHALAGRERAQA
jgi:hypothetical protein